MDVGSRSFCASRNAVVRCSNLWVMVVVVGQLERRPGPPHPPFPKFRTWGGQPGIISSLPRSRQYVVLRVVEDRNHSPATQLAQAKLISHRSNSTACNRYSLQCPSAKLLATAKDNASIPSIFKTLPRITVTRWVMPNGVQLNLAGSSSSNAPIWSSVTECQPVTGPHTT